MVEERGDEEEGEVKTNRVSHASPLPSTKHLASCSSLPFKKKTRKLLDLSNCHSCGLRCPSNGRREKLKTLDSQWRIVLLCNKCLRSIRSAEVCSYCFVKISETDRGFFDCTECSCRVHLSCIPRQRGFISPSEFDPDSFTCIDCCALPKSRNRNSCSFGDSFARTVSRILLEDIVRDAKSAAEEKAGVAARAKENALKKAVVAGRAADLARNALDAVQAAKEHLPSIKPVVPDEKLALQLHRAMNGSQRISRSTCPTNTDRLVDLKNVRGSDDSMDREADSGSYSVCKKVEVCSEDKHFLETMVLDWNSSLDLDSTEEREQKKEIDGFGKGGLVEIPVKEEEGSCSGKVVNSSRDDNSIGSLSGSYQKQNKANCINVQSKYGVGVGDDFSKLQRMKRFGTHDRYFKKYCKRHKSLKELTDMKES